MRSVSLLTTLIVLIGLTGCQSRYSYQPGAYIVAGRMFDRTHLGQLRIGETTQSEVVELLGKPFLANEYVYPPLHKETRHLADSVVTPGRALGDGHHEDLAHGRATRSEYQHGKSVRPYYSPGELEAWIYYERWRSPFYEHAWSLERVESGSRDIREHSLILIFRNQILHEIRDRPGHPEPTLPRNLAAETYPHEIDW
ncbi:MAG: hypothetical protein QF752_11335 [Planctomycetota bacterium]|nr:hypothetical protein [Planctomycetota bacterium]